MGRSGFICVSVMAEDAAGVVAAVMPVVALVDIVEIRLDSMREHGIGPCFAEIPRPVLVTNRPLWEGGQFAGDEQERIDLLCRAVQAGAQYVDIELRTAPDLRGQVQRNAHQYGAKMIVSNHDFQGTPPLVALRETLRQMVACGADIGKIVTTATRPEEALRILSLQQEALVDDFPLCAFAMGEAGKISRFATLYLGGFMTYAAISVEQATAPGQLAVHDLHTLKTFFDDRA